MNDTGDLAKALAELELSMADQGNPNAMDYSAEYDKVLASVKPPEKRSVAGISAAKGTALKKAQNERSK